MKHEAHISELAVTPRAASRGAMASRRARTAWLLLAPMMAVLVAVAGWPLLRSIWFSLTDASLTGVGRPQFIGFANYLALDEGEWIGLLADPDWWRAVWNTFRFAAISVSIEVALGTVFALVLNASFPGRGLVRAAVLVPWAVPTIVSARIWGWMLNDQFGVVNHVLLDLGWIGQPLAWTADPHLSMLSVVLVDVWKTTPFMTLMILAALQMLPSDCYEAARVDGVSPWQVFWRITLPLIKPALVVAVIFRTLDALRVFDVIYVLSSNNQSTMSMSIYARQQLVDFQDVGYGSAASTLLFLLIATCVALYMVLGKVRMSKEN
ncbi:carbohydrate ABC transporter permease [Pseudoduganella namucuonensis]|uniref:Carbohydrate ABC transporter membrane protein 1, CUT1 family n=1 Tax=Pseudoduganella namucuonensis TaxID=1035707 RepID=A0A1I7JX91_9BURK|nr:sugar ABC transporter permease [Pseudoduganella namucuonensis]SFU89804.1 carbohydrate ABC transporter membrane protein 1, CUT1 family [Pseudoduganella namucuonensis]